MPRDALVQACYAERIASQLDHLISLEPCIAPLLAGQRQAAVLCMLECGLSLGGYTSAALAHAYCDEALARPDRFLLLVASRQEEVMGYVVVLRANWGGFWRGFSLRHPRLALSMTWASLRSAKALPEDEVPYAWHAEISRSQRILMIAVAPSQRRQGLGQELYHAVFSRLVDQPLMALVSADNGPSMALHRTTGWVLTSEGNSRLATLENRAILQRDDR